MEKQTSCDFPFPQTIGGTLKGSYMKKYVTIGSFVFLSLIVCWSNSVAQWVSDSTKNTPICIASNSQQNPKIVSDGNNGAVIIWEDFRNNNWDIYAQKIDADGVAQWAKNGINLCHSNASQTSPVVASDDSGGAYIVWRDTRAGAGEIDLWAQHVRSDGSLAYDTLGKVVCNAKDPSGQGPVNLAICDDGFGNAFVAWEDSRTSTAQNNRPDIYMSKLGRTGITVGGQTGFAAIAQLSKQETPELVADGSGGCYLAWENLQSNPTEIKATRISSSGSVLWGQYGARVYKDQLAANTSRKPAINRDGNQLLICWELLNSSNTSNGWNLVSNRVKSDSTLVWGATNSGSEISTDWFGDQINGQIFSDDSTGSNSTNGLMVVYENNGTKKSIVMTRLLSDGASYKPSYPNHIYTVCSVGSTDQTAASAVKISSGELMVAWTDSRFGSYTSIYGQRIDRSPKRYLGPSNSSWGEAISNHVNTNADQVALVARTNGAIAVWRDDRNGNTDIYAQLIFRDGTLPIELSSFNVSPTTDGHVVLNWETANERENAGFEIERRRIADGASNQFEVVASYQNDPSLRGMNFSGTKREYAHVDLPGGPGLYEYRLVDYTLDGERTSHEPKQIEVSDLSTGSVAIGQNMPNPFSEKTMIPVTLASGSLVSVRITDVLGRVVAMPYENTLLSAGTHQLQIGASQLSGSGSYYCTVTVTDPNTGSVVWSSPKAMLMQVVR